MAVYKVLQDIEAEDKLLGPLTLKQFIFAIITVILIALMVFFGRINIILILPWIVPVLFFGFMASPIGRDQPNDVWLAARIRFLIKPRKRHWNQAGMQELVTITAPKKQEIVRTDGLSQVQVKSRLNALASTLDSRGWAVKNVNVNMSDPSYIQADNASDRLIDISTIQTNEDVVDVRADDDILDPMNNMVARRFDTAIKKQHEEHVQKLRKLTKEENVKVEAVDYSFITNPSVEPGYTTFGAQVVAPTSTKTKQTDSFLEDGAQATSDPEADFLEKQHKREKIEKQILSHGHEKVILPLDEQAELEKQKAAEAKDKPKADAPAGPPHLRDVPLPPEPETPVNPQPFVPQNIEAGTVTPAQTQNQAAYQQPTQQVQPYQPNPANYQPPQNQTMQPPAGYSPYAAMNPMYDPQYYQPPVQPVAPPPPRAPDDILEELGQSNDLSVASLASLAKHAEKEAALHDNDVIDLH